MSSPTRQSTEFSYRDRLLALAESVNETARMTRINLSLTLTTALYLTLTLLAATDENVVRNSVVKLPQIEGGISLKASFAFAPVVFVFLHAQTLALLVVLTRKVKEFERLLDHAFPNDHETAAECRNWMSGFSLVQGLVGTGGFARVAIGLTWIGAVGIPLLLLLLIDLSFLRHQVVSVSLVHHICFCLDLIGVWMFWRHVRTTESEVEWRDFLYLLRRQRDSERVAKAGAMLWRASISVMQRVSVGVLVAVLWIYAWPIGFGQSTTVLAFLSGRSHTGLHLIDDLLCPSSPRSSYSWREVCRFLRLRGASLQNADLRGRSLLYADLREADLRGADLRNADLRDANLRGADLESVDLRGADLGETNLRNAILRNANLQNTDLRKTKLDGVDLSRANLTYADLKDVDLSGVYGPLRGRICQVLESRGSRRYDIPYMNGPPTTEYWVDRRSVVDLSDSKLNQAKLQESTLVGVNLQRAVLQLADMSDACIVGGNLRGVDLRYTILKRAYLTNADLSGADLRYADLSGADLSYAVLSGADLSTARSLREDRLHGACGNDDTQLPGELTVPKCVN